MLRNCTCKVRSYMSIIYVRVGTYEGGHILFWPLPRVLPFLFIGGGCLGGCNFLSSQDTYMLPLFDVILNLRIWGMLLYMEPHFLCKSHPFIGAGYNVLSHKRQIFQGLPKPFICFKLGNHFATLDFFLTFRLWMGSSSYPGLEGGPRWNFQVGWTPTPRLKFWLDRLDAPLTYTEMTGRPTSILNTTKITSRAPNTYHSTINILSNV